MSNQCCKLYTTLSSELLTASSSPTTEPSRIATARPWICKIIKPRRSFLISDNFKSETATLLAARARVIVALSCERHSKICTYRGDLYPSLIDRQSANKSPFMLMGRWCISKKRDEFISGNIAALFFFRRISRIFTSNLANQRYKNEDLSCSS